MSDSNSNNGDLLNISKDEYAFLLKIYNKVLMSQLGQHLNDTVDLDQENKKKEDTYKVWYSYDQIHESIKEMAQKIIDSDFNPDAMIAIGAGGFIPARMLRTFLNIPIYTITTSYYDENGQHKAKPETVQWLDGAERYLKNKNVLLIDEVDDTRVTLEYCLNELKNSGIVNVGVAVIHKKNKPKKGQFPDYVQHYFCGVEIDDIWICYPWDAQNIREHDLLSATKNKTFISLINKAEQIALTQDKNK